VAKRHFRQRLFAIQEAQHACDAPGGFAHVAGVKQARLMAVTLEALLRGSSFRPFPLSGCSLDPSSATAKAGPSKGMVDTGGLRVNSRDTRGDSDSNAALREPCTAPSSGEADDTKTEAERRAAAERTRALLAAKAKLQPTGLAVTSQGLWTVAKKPTLGHASLGSVKSLDADSSPLPAPSFACVNIEEEGGFPSSSSPLPM